MNSKLTLASILVLVVLAAYVYFFELESSEPDSSADSAIPLYDAIYSEYDIAELEIEGPQKAARFTRTDITPDQPWEMVEPEVIPADQLDQVMVNGAAVRLGKLTASQVITGALDLAQYGLRPPELTTTLTISNGQQLVLYAGTAAPIGNSRYVRTQNDAESVYLVFDFAIEELFRLIEAPPLLPPETAAP